MTPYGKVPVLEIEGQLPIAQSGAILRFLARKFDLEGKTDDEVTKADELYGYFGDVTRIIAPYLVVHAGLAPGDKVLHWSLAFNFKIFQDKVYEEVFVPSTKEFLPIYNQLLSESKSGFLLPSGLTYIDFVIAEQLHTVCKVNAGIFDEYPELIKYKERVHSLPEVKEYVSARPDPLV